MRKGTSKEATEFILCCPLLLGMGPILKTSWYFQWDSIGEKEFFLWVGDSILVRHGGLQDWRFCYWICAYKPLYKSRKLDYERGLCSRNGWGFSLFSFSFSFLFFSGASLFPIISSPVQHFVLLLSNWDHLYKFEYNVQRYFLRRNLHCDLQICSEVKHAPTPHISNVETTKSSTIWILIHSPSVLFYRQCIIQAGYQFQIHLGITFWVGHLCLYSVRTPCVYERKCFWARKYSL